MPAGSVRTLRATVGVAAAWIAPAFLVVGCDEPEARGSDGRRVEISAAPADESRPIPQGFTHRPPPNTPGLPPPIAPFLSDSERHELASEREVSRDARAGAHDELLALVADFETRSAPELVTRLRDKAREHAREARLWHMSADELYRAYLFPNDVNRANTKFKGRPVVLTAAVAPHNMTVLADGFKLFEQTPYVHEPVLLATHQELAFVRCRLAKPERQKLRDWQEIHIIGVVAGKNRGDVVLDRCVVLQSS